MNPKKGSMPLHHKKTILNDESISMNPKGQRAAAPPKKHLKGSRYNTHVVLK